MNIIFFGSAHFAVPSLKALISGGHKIAAVVTQPDRKKGRGLHLEGTVVKQLALKARLKIFQPQNINSSESLRFLKAQGADLFIVIAYGQILSSEILGLPRVLAVNAHASLLPQYRGAAPINWAIINGEKATGVTIMKMVRKMDAGPMILQQAVDIQAEDTAVTLEEKLSVAAAALLVKALGKIKTQTCHFLAQEESQVSFAPKLKKADGLINWQDPAWHIRNLVRGCLEWPGAYTHYRGKLLKVFQAKIVPLSAAEPSYAPGEIIRVSKEGICVATGEQRLLIEDLQIEGKRRMTSAVFLAGHKMHAGEILSKK